jgi:hypothetical protein
VYVLLTLAAVVWTYLWLRWSYDNEVFGFDFRGTLWDAGIAIREGRSPYPAPLVSEIEVGNPALYPPLLILLVTPLTILPWAVGFAIWTGILVAALAGTLYALEVRDSRCYALTFLSAPAISALSFGNATVLLVPLVALAWRWRAAWLRSGALIGVAIAAKLFLWPLVFWLVGTRRYRAAGAAALATVLGIFVPWAAIGFDGLRAYPDLLEVANDLYAVHSFSIATMLNSLGVPASDGSRAALAVGVLVAVGAFYVGRRGNERASISLAVLAAVMGSPILWPYYYALLLIPLAIARPRFGGLWIALPLFWLALRLPEESLSPSDYAEGGVACCRPQDVPGAIWNFNHSPPRVWPALALAALGICVVALAVRALSTRPALARTGSASTHP